MSCCQSLLLLFSNEDLPICVDEVCDDTLVITRGAHDAILDNLSCLLPLTTVFATSIGADDASICALPDRALSIRRDALHDNFVGTPGRKLRCLVHRGYFIAHETVHNVFEASPHDHLLLM